MRKQKTKKNAMLYLAVPRCSDPQAQYFSQKRAAVQYCEQLPIPADLYHLLEVYR